MIVFFTFIKQYIMGEPLIIKQFKKFIFIKKIKSLNCFMIKGSPNNT